MDVDDGLRAAHTEAAAKDIGNNRIVRIPRGVRIGRNPFGIWHGRPGRVRRDDVGGRGNRYVRVWRAYEFPIRVLRAQRIKRGRRVVHAGIEADTAGQAGLIAARARPALR